MDSTNTSLHKLPPEFPLLLAKLIHELRTPLTSVCGYSEILSSGHFDPEQSKEFGEAIHRNSLYLRTLVDDLLNLLRLKSESVSVEFKEFELLAFCDEIAASFEQRASQAGITFGIEYHFPLPQRISSDSLRLKQALLNLTANAIKFTKEGGVKLSVRFDSQRKQLVFDVVDTGIGLTPEQLNKLFHPFQQANLEIEKHFGGSGLGLYLTKELIEHLHGVMTVESEAGRGSTFSVTLPVEVSSETCDVQSSPETPQKKARRKKIPSFTGKVLVVDDDRDIAALLKLLMVQTGVRVAIADSNESAQKLIRTNVYDLLFLDHSVAGKDGSELPQAIQSIHPKLPIIAFTAEHTGKRRKWMKEAHLSDYLPKPFEHKQLYKLLRKHLPTLQSVLQDNSPLLSELSDENSALDRIVHDFIGGLPDRSAKIRTCILENNLQEAQAELHRLCAAAIFGFPSLGAAARDLHGVLKESNTDQVTSSLQIVEHIIQRIVKGAA